MGDKLYEIFLTILPFLVTGALTFIGTMITLRSRRSLEDSEEVENYSLALQRQGEYAAKLLEPLGKRIDELEEKQVKLLQQFDECSGNNDVLQDEINALRYDIDSLRKENSRLAGRVEELEKENSALHRVNNRLRERVRVLEKEKEE